ncbi:MAG: ParB/RepB/Spo0J family partition protein [Candidatus Brocadiaceae bacterium]
MSKLKDKLAEHATKLAKDRVKIDDHPVADYYQDGGFYKIPLENITPDPNQPRKYFDPQTLEELSNSIKQKGVLQPVIIRRNKDGGFILVAGERRFRAAKMARLEAIPSIITSGNPEEIALIENLQRENLNPIEEAQAYERMIKEHGYTQEKLAEVIGKARPTITLTLSLNRLPEQIKNECSHANIAKRDLIEIARKETSEEMIDLFNKVKDGILTSDQLRKAVRKRIKKTNRTPAAIAIDKTVSLAQFLEKLELNTIEESEKERLKSELHGLQHSINRLLTQ